MTCWPLRALPGACHKKRGDTRLSPEAGVRRSVSGVRGTADQLTGACVEGYTKAFATYLGEHGDVRLAVVGSDTRATSDDYRRRVTEALLATGWDVIDLGVVPTPTAQIAVAGLNAAGGVVVTASHNPARYNGLKLLRNEGGHGLFLHKEQAENVFAIYDDKRFATGPRGHYRHVRELARALEAPDYVGEYLRGVGGPAVDNGVALNYHLHRVVTAMGEDVGAIRARNLRVVMDCCGGAGSPIDYALLAHLHTRLTRVNEAPGVFTREIEPTPENLRDLCDRLGNDSDTYDVGFVTDCDNDRCVLVGWHPDAGRYEPLEEDYTLAIAVDQALRARNGGGGPARHGTAGDTLSRPLGRYFGGQAARPAGHRARLGRWTLVCRVPADRRGPRTKGTRSLWNRRLGVVRALGRYLGRRHARLPSQRAGPLDACRATVVAAQRGLAVSQTQRIGRSPPRPRRDIGLPAPQAHILVASAPK